MRKIKEILRLKFDGKQSNRNIAISRSVNRSTVADYLLALGQCFTAASDPSRYVPKLKERNNAIISKRCM